MTSSTALTPHFAPPQPAAPTPPPAPSPPTRPPNPAPPAIPQDPYAISQAPGGGACPTTESALPNQPGFEAGTEAPLAGAYSPFVLHLARADGSQNLQGLDLTLPPGLLGRLAGVAECPSSAIAQAEGRSGEGQGALEQASPSCPASSEVGTIAVGAGAGPDPFYAHGHAYLAGPYKGAPLSFVTITPALAGPFDLGVVVDRVALQVDPFTAQIHAVTDTIPHILDGIPLDVRSITVQVNRPEFTLNPTNCSPLSIPGDALSTLGTSAALSEPFQVGNCAALGFKPKLAFSLTGQVRRRGHPALKAVLTYPKGSYANIARAQVTLPGSEILDQSHVNSPCTRVQFAQAACPPGSVLGYARAYTPLLDNPLEGPVYLMTGFGHQLPDVVADLGGQIDVLLDGKVDSGREGGLRNTFLSVPDAPVSKFVLSLKGGRVGLLQNSENLCSPSARRTAVADLTAQNGKVYDTKPTVHNSCKGKPKKHRGGPRHG